jgi:hypothetical protein
MKQPGLPILIITGTLLLFASACRTRKQQPLSVADSVQVQAIPCPLPDSLLKNLKASDTRFEWFSARISASTEIDKKSNVFTASLRIRRDSAIWMSITPALGIEVARVLITRDSLRFINRIDGTYFRGDYRYLKELLQTEVNFQMIQAVLLGNIYLHYLPEQYVSVIDNGLCLLSTLRKRRIRRETELEIPEILTQEIWCTAGNQKISKMEMQDYRPVRKFSVQYLSFQNFESNVLPDKISVFASASKTARIDLEYSKFQLDKVLNLPFSIPENYEPFR